MTSFFSFLPMMITNMVAARRADGGVAEGSYGFKPVNPV